MEVVVGAVDHRYLDGDFRAYAGTLRRLDFCFRFICPGRNADEKSDPHCDSQNSNESSSFHFHPPSCPVEISAISAFETFKIFYQIKQNIQSEYVRYDIFE